MKKQFGRKIRNLIAQFRGLPRETSVSCLKKAKPIGELLFWQLKKVSQRKNRPEAVIQNNWPAIIGGALANRCSPSKVLNNDILVIRCSSPVVRSELQLMQAKILENLHKFSVCEKISSLRFIANG